MGGSLNSGFSDISESIFAGFDACWPKPEFNSTPETVLVAVSGGSDSVALLILTQHYLTQRRPESRLLAVTIDHQLRAESAAEAEDVGQLCAALKIEHQILRWEGQKPASGIASAARTARYALLAQAARQAGARIILSGHTADDQVETCLMREKRLHRQGNIAGEGRGLAAMAPQTLLQNSILLCRPLLEIGRESLRDFLRARNISWVDDPSNDNLAYERPRTRQAAQFTDKLAVLRKIGQSAQQRLSDNYKLAALLGKNEGQFQRTATDGLLLRDGWRDGWNQQCLSLTPLALAYLLTAIGGKALLPALSDCAELAQWLTDASLSGDARRTLHHCVLERQSGNVLIRRERRDLPEQVVESGQTLIWDGRYSVTNETDYALTIGTVHAQQLSDYLRRYEIEPLPVSREALLSAPAVLLDGHCAEIPALTGLTGQHSKIRLKRHFACFDNVLSGYDFVVAGAVKALLTMPLDHKVR